MSLSVSERMTRVRPSPTSAALALAAELKAAGRDVVSLGAGEPDFDTPAHVKQAAIDAIHAGMTKYTPIDGTAELKAAIQRKFVRDNNLHYEPGQILVSSGAKQTLFNVCQAVLSPGDEAIVPAPYWVSYPDMVRLADAEPVIIETDIEAEFKISANALKAALTDRTRLLFLNSPSNPTGSCYSKAELEKLGSVLAKFPQVVIAADDIYEKIYWADEPFCSFASACPELADRTVTINGVSKSHAMTGWRIGYAGGPAAVIGAMKTIQSQCTSNPCSISQAAAIAALDGDQTCVEEMVAAYRERSRFISMALNELPGFQCREGQGAFYAFPRVESAIKSLKLEDDGEFVRYLLQKADVAMVQGSAFGAPGYVRISFACSMSDLETAVERIRNVLV
ncbi:MAG: pyridoxal phosphate-dependent aminotransferase [Gammaproteobacteria bacterium]|nr:pyridoxal phosphate-dependent aminotransferase [Gammaproteobacteria bacterium]MDH4314832.1 pyridoxal phosphate-dependent aminotransferase [Gammaproteobacteria bacterium]MDH5215419.1 pyridoxal phosphate-dependent aminotransferase [Gammaproteobacteria bacterium]